MNLFRNNNNPGHLKRKLYSKLDHEIEKYKFISVARLEELINQRAVSGILGEETSPEVSESIVSSSRKLFAILVLLDSEREILRFHEKNADDNEFPLSDDEELCCETAAHTRLHSEIMHKQWVVPPVFRKSQHLELPASYIPPFLEIDEIDGGSFGIVYKVTVAKGHLPERPDTVLALKKIRPGRGTDWEYAWREVETLRARQHEHIIPLFASFTVFGDESGFETRVLNLLFPFAMTDMEEWMDSAKTPHFLRDLSDPEERRAFVLRSVCELISGLAFLHRNIDGRITSHHDLKPRNILLFEDGWKLSDLGSTQLVSSDEGSATLPSGTFAYEPPECWDGSEQQGRHPQGRSFDIWSMGCIIIELAVLSVYGWKHGKRKEFRKDREQNTNRRRLIQRPREAADDSFHNNPEVVERWIRKLRDQDTPQHLSRTMDIAEEMLREDPKERPHSWELGMDFSDLLIPTESIEERRKRVADLIQGPGPQSDELKRGPVRRAALQGNKLRLELLFQRGWTTQCGDFEAVRTDSEMDSATREEILTFLAHTIVRKRLRMWRLRRLIQEHQAHPSQPGAKLLERPGTLIVSGEQLQSPPGRRASGALYERDENGLPMLHSLCKSADYNAVAKHLHQIRIGREKAELMLLRDDEGKVPLHHACSSGRPARLVSLLLTKFWLGQSVIWDPAVSITIQDNNDRTPLHIASYSRNMGAYNALARASTNLEAYMNILDSNGKRAIDYEMDS